MRLVNTSYELIGHIMQTDIYNQIAIQGEEIDNTSFGNINPALLQQIDTAWSYDTTMAQYYKETISEMKPLFDQAKESKSVNVK